MSDMTHGGVPSIAEIRRALEDIPGAIRQDPLPEDVRAGTDAATRLWPPPDLGNLTDDHPLDVLDRPATSDMPDAQDGDDGFSDEPGVIFEVPPDLTEAKIENVLGERGSGDLKRLEQVRGIDAFGWYVTFHQRSYQHGIYIPIEGGGVIAS